ncbi:Putative NADH-flavin reductase [Tranquillimonas rosea]|uniref:Putative NADH-flavin reductase n=1 Tax=Tranquillimonas rosea TaxID=641238 RepID=A0A1H9WR49_9RHOB|nr:NAD(P)-binding oxidoreductase [Tranquillimonas rosea]SES35863.1 Putative NADH-flavin reductase [Tranquillimonas rosea]
MSAPILVMGGTSGIGKLAVDEILSRGLTARAFGRSAAEMPAAANLEPVAGDALDADDVQAALTGSRAVIYALGIKERVAMLWQEETLFSESTRILLQAMMASQVRRLVAVTGFGAGRSKDAMSWVEKTGHAAVLGKPYADKDRQEELIVQSELDWTIARPVILTNGRKSGRYKVLRDPAGWHNGLISRADVASYLVDAVEQDLDIRGDVVLSRS